MNSLVVLFTLASVACGSLVPVAQPPHHSAVVLDPHGRPLDTAEVINARALHLQAKALEGHYAPVAHSVYAAPLAHSVVAPAAVSHQSRIDIHSSPAVVSHGYAGAYAAPLAYAGLGHYLKKRSLGHIAYSAPIIAPSAVSHQSRVDVITSPAVVSHAVAAPVLAHAAPVIAHVAPAAVSHQSRVDIRSSPAIVSHAVAPVTYSAYAIAPLAHSVYSAGPLAHSVYGSQLLARSAFSHGHLLKKRSLGYLAYSTPLIAPSAVSHQSRVDVISAPAVVSHAVAPVVVAHAAPVTVAHAVPAAVSHQSRVDVISSAARVAPVVHSSFWSSPLSHLAHAAHW